MTTNSAAPLAGRRALVTGGSRGIGAEIVRRLVADGAAVAFTYQSSAETAEALAAELSNGGTTVVAIQADSADADAVFAAVDETAARLGGLDILVNNAGIAYGAPIEEIPLAEFDRSVAVNVRGVFAATQRAVTHLGEGGRIITIGSVNADRVPMAGFSVYALTKAAVAGLTRGLVRELGPRGITVNCVNPGPVDSASYVDDDLRASLAGRFPFGRWGEPDDPARLIAWLVSDDGRWVTGQVINTEGGFIR